MIRLAALAVALCCTTFAAAALEAPLPGASVYNLSSQWTTQDGRRMPLASLRGEPVVLAMIYTSCADTCPLIVQNMLNIHDEIPAAARMHTHFALFSFDTARDTPDHLKAYAKGLSLSPRDWTLFHGDDNAVRELAAVLGIAYRRKPNGDFSHSVMITLLDADGVIVYQQNGIEGHSTALERKLDGLLKR